MKLFLVRVNCRFYFPKASVKLFAVLAFQRVIGHTSWNNVVATVATWGVLSRAARQTHDGVVFCTKRLLRQRLVTLCTMKTVFMPVAAFVAQLLRNEGRSCLKYYKEILTGSLEQTTKCTPETNLWIHRDRTKALGTGVGTKLAVAVNADNFSFMTDKLLSPKILTTVEAVWAVCHCHIQIEPRLHKEKNKLGHSITDQMPRFLYC